jgi:hypothetical protein
MNTRFPGIVTHYFPSAETIEQRQAAAEIERLRDMVGSLAEDLRIALGIIEQQGGQVPRVWLRVLRQNMEEAEREATAHDSLALPVEGEISSSPTVISLRGKRRAKRRKRQDTRKSQDDKETR